MKMAQQKIENLRNQARETGKVQTATITINGRECKIMATPGRGLFQGTNIKIEYKTLDGQTCTADFTYDGDQDAAPELQSFIENTKVVTLSQFSSKIADYTQPTSIGLMDSHASAICIFLKNTENFVRQNDLTEEEISMLKQELRKLCGTPIIESSEGNFSINECDGNTHCCAIALQAESLEILLDAKACGQVRLERNVPPKVEELGSGTFNTVKLAHTKPGVDGGEASGPIVLKPCGQSKKEKSLPVFREDAEVVQCYVGTVSGSYRRNKATAKVQDMLCELGTNKEINVPRVIASVSAGEMEGVPCIAMEALEGKTVGSYTVFELYKIYKNNNFIRRETWIQVQDVLTGQIDRNRSNVILTKDGPVAIDHDLSFPTNPPRNFAAMVPATLVSLGPSTKEEAVDGRSPTNYCMPPVIDQEMYDVIMAIDLGELKNMYEECGLTRSEIVPAMARAKGLKAEAQKLMGEGRVIDPAQWIISPWVTSSLVKKHCNGKNFYATRHSSKK
jgi:hypothetical protein